MAKTKSSFLPVCLATGVLVPLLCIAVCIAACIVPFEKAQTYLNILFMDNMKIIPSTGLEGLVIVDNADIPTGEDNTRTLSDAGEIVRPSFGEQYAVLTCEAVSMRVPVYWGTGDQLFEKGACQSSSSAVLGETGNAVIDAHVNTFFSSLSEIEPGDEIVLYTSAGELTVRGRELHVREVDLEAGALHVEGDIWSLWYGDRDKRSPLGLLGRLLR